jgi:hypothetical protein
MTKSEFGDLFIRSLDQAARNADSMMGREVPRFFLIEFHGPGHDGRLLSTSEALNPLYLGSDRFYRIIDVAVEKVTPSQSVAFVCVSGHPPSAFKETWNPVDAGPFKQIFSQKIEELRTDFAQPGG